MNHYLLITVQGKDYKDLCDRLNALGFPPCIIADVTPHDIDKSWAQWGGNKDRLGDNVDAVEAVFQALLDVREEERR